MARDAPDVEIRGHLVHEVGVFINDGNIVLFPRQSPGNPVPNATCAANKYAHFLMPFDGHSAVLTRKTGGYAQSL